MIKKINPALRRVWRDPQTIQFGYLPGFVIKNPSPVQERMISLLESGITSQQEKELHFHAGSSEVEAEDFMSRLKPILVESEELYLSEEYVVQRFAEIVRISLSTAKNPAEVIAARNELEIFISELSRPGLVLAQALSVSGVGMIFTDDAKKVSKSDTELLGHPNHSIGLNRTSSAKEILRGSSKVELHSKMTDPIYERADFAILLSNEVVAPTLYQPWLTRETPHLSIYFHERGVTVSPVVIPGNTPCLGCSETQRIALDPSWLSIAPQLAANPRDLADTSSLLFAASVVSRGVLEFCDAAAGFRVARSLTGFEFNQKTGEIYGIEFANANCGCRI